MRSIVRETAASMKRVISNSRSSSPGNKPLPGERRLLSRRMASCSTVACGDPSRRIACAMLLRMRAFSGRNDRAVRQGRRDRSADKSAAVTTCLDAHLLGSGLRPHHSCQRGANDNQDGNSGGCEWYHHDRFHLSRKSKSARSLLEIQIYSRGSSSQLSCRYPGARGTRISIICSVECVNRSSGQLQTCSL
jgi:hypothetical protein